MTPLLVAALATTAVSGGLQMVASQQRARAQEAELERRRKEEETKARDAELQRREQVNKVLAAQIAGGAASGTAFEGSPTQIAKTDIQKADLANMGASASLSGMNQAINSQKRSARRLGNLSSATSLFNTAANIGMNVPWE